METAAFMLYHCHPHDKAVHFIKSIGKIAYII